MPSRARQRPQQVVKVRVIISGFEHGSSSSVHTQSSSLPDHHNPISERNETLDVETGRTDGIGIISLNLSADQVSAVAFRIGCALCGRSAYPRRRPTCICGQLITYMWLRRRVIRELCASISRDVISQQCNRNRNSIYTQSSISTNFHFFVLVNNCASKVNITDLKGDRTQIADVI